MSEQKFPPRVFVIARQIGMGKYSTPVWNFVAHNKMWRSSDGVPEQYLSLAEHQHLMAEKDKRIERLREELEGLLCYWTNTPCRFDHNGNCQAHSCFGYDKTCSVADARAALQEEEK